MQIGAVIATVLAMLATLKLPFERRLIKAHATAHREKSALVKQLMRHLHSKKRQDRILPALLCMRYKAGDFYLRSLLAMSARHSGRAERQTGWLQPLGTQPARTTRLLAWAVLKYGEDF